MPANAEHPDNQMPASGSILRAVTNIIVPEGMDDIEVRIGKGSVKVRKTGEDNDFEITPDPIETADVEEELAPNN